MANPCHKTLIFDPITFKGGSKIATSDALNTCVHNGNEFIVATVDPKFWLASDFYHQHNVKVLRILPIPWLTKQHNGMLYWLNQVYFLLALALTMLCHRGLNQFVGASGPGIDMPVYFLKFLLNIKVIQFVHGNVGLSRSIGWCLTKADNVFYLPSARHSLREALQAYLEHKTKIADSSAIAERYLRSAKYQPFVNGIPASRWPTRCQTSLPVGFWAASLLRWKGLETLVEAAHSMTGTRPLPFNICFIRPVDTCLDVSCAPVPFKHARWFEDPADLDQIRSQSNIFVSTSCNEPFGLSILEALAAGMCVVIPQDGAFWDQQLTHKVNCIKYQANDAHSLAAALCYITSKPNVFELCCGNAIKVASQYRAESRYREFANAVDSHGASATLRAWD